MYLEERLMYSFEVSTVKPLRLSDVEYGIFLWILHADKIPPHIGISKNGFYYSLKVSGKDEHFSVEKLIALLNRKKIASLVIKSSENSIRVQQLAEVFDKYQSIENDKHTCLTPISEIYFSEPKDLILSELLNLLNEAGVLEEIYGINLPTSYGGILYYERNDIQNRLNHLKYVKGAKNIS